MSSLKFYQEKRDFTRTPEPAGTVPGKPRPKSSELIFVVHKHNARRLHYDLRLEHGGVLWSWAVAKGPSLNPAMKRLSIHVEDHPLQYAGFEGVIPEGYGAGTVIIWDEGTWTPLEDPVKGMEKGHLSFELKGEKLFGRWNLVRLKKRGNEKRDNWLLIKVDDEHAKNAGDILLKSPRSVHSGLTVEELSQNLKRDRVKPQKIVLPKQRTKIRTLPDFIPFALATLKASPPAGEKWLHEVKFDGYRIQAHLHRKTLKLISRSGLDWTHRFGSFIANKFLSLPCKQAIIDGEIVVLTDKGVASFAALQAELSAKRVDHMVFFAFDLLYLDGKALLDLPLRDRKAQLEKLLAKQDGRSALRYSAHFTEAGETMLTHACRMGLEGVVSKNAEAPYTSGRTMDWIKSKCTLRQEFIIIGYHASKAEGRGIQSLLVAYNDKGALKFAGRVGTGFNKETGDELKWKLERLRIKSTLVEGLPRTERRAIWVRPDLVAEVEFRTWTAQGFIRQGSFLGLRDDKAPDDVTMEKTSAARQNKSGSVSLSNAGKILWPQAKVTKQDLLNHYETVWPNMERFVINRPLSLLRAPDGVDGQRFFQKHASPGMHDVIATMRDPVDGEELLYIKNFDGLAALVQLGVVEIHIWGATTKAIETPDQIVFDLDPDEGLPLEELCAAALDVRQRLAELGFPALLKTSGGKGFHIIVPLKPKTQWEETKTFARDFAKALAQSNPKRYTATLSKKARKGRIFIDYLRNNRGSTTVAPFSTRANADAAVSMPIGWERLREHINPRGFVLGDTANARAMPEGWVDFFNTTKILRRV